MIFSTRQRQAMSWWCDCSPWREMEAIICDGAVRSGKTFCLGLGFFCWAMRRFNGAQFALCARTVGAVRRNLLHPVEPYLKELGFTWEEKVSRNQLKVRFGGNENTFWLFGGKDAGSAGLIQGVTLAGAFLDEAALMPRSFVEQAVARCSERGAKVWFSCNPEGPEHWFYQEWILKAEEKRALRIRFRMEDNPALSRETLARYKRQFTGSFYQRFVLGEWVQATGRVYDFFDGSYVKEAPAGGVTRWRISCDYGTVNPTSMGLWGEKEGVWYRVEEFYYDSRREGRQKTDREYEEDLERLAGGREIEEVIVDPSAASFLTCLRQAGWPARAANNDVATGIRVTADLLRRGRLVICGDCVEAIREFSLYCWDEKAVGDKVIKRFDHAMDDIRYFAMSTRESGYIGGWGVTRKV